jgi:hypothetical protein
MVRRSSDDLLHGVFPGLCASRQGGGNGNGSLHARKPNGNLMEMVDEGVAAVFARAE